MADVVAQTFFFCSTRTVPVRATATRHNNENDRMDGWSTYGWMDGWSTYGRMAHFGFLHVSSWGVHLCMGRVTFISTISA